MVSKKDEDYEHWPDDAKLQATKSAPIPRYDSHTGLFEHTYRPAGEVKKTAPMAAVDMPKQDPAPPYAQYAPYPQVPYGQVPYMAYPAPAYYGYGGQPLYPPTYDPNYITAAAGAPLVPAEPAKDAKAAFPKPKDDDKAKDKATEEKPKAPSPRKWQGRTKAEVEEDDMKVAAKEGAYAPRKVLPQGLADDQVVWVVETDGTNLLRCYVEVKDAKGEWKADPRFKNSWYFVRAEEAKEEKEKK